MLHQIGTGTLGPVFRTYEPTRDRLVAVKVFRLDIVPEQAHALAATLARATQASLFHPSIVEPIDAGVEGTLAYRAEEYVAAESLDVALRHYAPAPVERVLPFITQLAGAIDFARAAGIGHGGLHPRDIFVTPDDARATGFGVVEALEQVGIRAPIRRPYSAPERIDGRAWGTPADVFSLAAITFELLTAKRPSGTGAEIGALPDAPHAPAIHTVLARAMDDDPAKRYVSALAFAGALEAASQGRPLTDAVSQVTAIAAVQPGARIESRLEPAPPEPTTVAAPDDEPILDDNAPGVSSSDHVGEFAVEQQLDPAHEALDDLRSDRGVEHSVLHTPTLFEDAVADDRGDDRFADDFVDEQQAEAEIHSPLEDEPHYAELAPAAVEAPMFRAADGAPDAHDFGERTRSPVLPYALTLVLGLLAGFAGGYFMGSRDRLPTADGTAPVSTATTSRSAAVAAAGAATAEKPGQYSEQKVTPAPQTAASARAVNSPAATAPAARTAAPAAATRPVPAATRGQLVVRSQPPHAGVTVNNKWRGRTPLTLDDLPFGHYTVRVVQPGYAVAHEEVTLNAKDPSRTFTPRLERAPKAAPAAPAAAPAPSTPVTFSGSLYVDSRPRGATVLVDGKSVGQTPLSLPDVRVGSHVVRIEMTGKKPVMANPRVVAGKTERVTVSLEDK